MKKILFVFGTRPEAIKLAPLILEAKKDKKLKTIVVSSGQHREILKPVIDLFKIKIDYDLKIMRKNQTLSEMTSRILTKISPLIEKIKPNLIIVQGDTTTALIGALVSYYQQIPVGHIEAGLRSYDKYQPFPEEINRSLISAVADLHFAPTKEAKINLAKEGIKKNVYNVGNTVIDAIKIVKPRLKTFNDPRVNQINFKDQIILVTTHRRENIGQPMENIAKAMLTLSQKYSHFSFVLPMHPNPKVRTILNKLLSRNPKIHLIEPLDYLDFVLMMKKSYLILTDSGGVQEEAPTLGKPVLVLRQTTERQEGIKAGTAILAGTDTNRIVSLASKLIDNKKFYQKVSKTKNPYGDGKSSQKIINIIKKYLDESGEN